MLVDMIKDFILR